MTMLSGALSTGLVSMTLVPMMLASTAAWVWLRPVRARRAAPDGGSSPARPIWLAVPVVVAAWLLPPSLTGVVVILGLAGLSLLALWRRRRLRSAAEAVAGEVAEACARLAAQLSAGRPPGAALADAADECRVLAPAAEAFVLGADVPAALRRAASAPGAGQLRLLAAAWQVSHRTGAGLALALAQLAESLREERATQRLVDGELASARATARLVAALPVAALAMGSGAGGDPWSFLATTPIGLACLAAGLALALLGLWWIEALCAE